MLINHLSFAAIVPTFRKTLACTTIRKNLRIIFKNQTKDEGSSKKFHSLQMEELLLLHLDMEFDCLLLIQIAGNLFLIWWNLGTTIV